jgi:hypothetical protein
MVFVPLEQKILAQDSGAQQMPARVHEGVVAVVAALRLRLPVLQQQAFYYHLRTFLFYRVAVADPSVTYHFWGPHFPGLMCGAVGSTPALADLTNESTFGPPPLVLLSPRATPSPLPPPPSPQTENPPPHQLPPHRKSPASAHRGLASAAVALH